MGVLGIMVNVQRPMSNVQMQYARVSVLEDIADFDLCPHLTTDSIADVVQVAAVLERAKGSMPKARVTVSRLQVILILIGSQSWHS